MWKDKRWQPEDTRNPSSVRLPSGMLSVCSLHDCRYRRRWKTRLGLRLNTDGVWLQDAWYCSLPCVEQALQQSFEISLERSPATAPAHRVPLGLMLVSKGHLTISQLQSSLAMQRTHGGRLGHWLQKSRYITEQQLTAVLGLQWACPVMPLLDARHLAYARLLPSILLTQFHILPVWHFSQTGKLVIAFSNGIDYALLNAIGEMLLCHPEPCLLPSSLMDAALAEIDHLQNSGDVLFENVCSAYEMTRAISGYISHWNAQRVRFVYYRSLIWARLSAGLQNINLLFHRS